MEWNRIVEFEGANKATESNSMINAGKGELYYFLGRKEFLVATFDSDC